MYKYMYPPLEIPPMRCYYMMVNRNIYPSVMCMKLKCLFKEKEEFEKNKVHKGSTIPHAEKKSYMKQEMPDMMDMSK
ncbi:hypothetical protein ACJDU8_25490 [Clostridium sp. WILCCON 0269]|uniref:Uncharacterized protein n=1 Tax=Candidatus Clostridium eludens TaxID=3381663 RepID=A0ABW8SVR9_9CLOT